MFSCCTENRESVVAPCGRTWTVCSVCDRGINDCTEGYCQHDRISDRGPNEPCQKGTVGCSIEHTKDGECETW